MKKTILIVMVVLIGTGILFAGGGQSSSAGGAKSIIYLVSNPSEAVITGRGVDNPGKNLVEEFEKELGIKVEFTAGATGTDEAQTRLFRVGSLSRTEEDVISVLHSFADDRITGLLEPLNKYLQEKPLDGYPGDWSKGMLDVYTKNGQIYSIPARAGVWCFFYNERIFKERGIAGPPQTPEEFYEIAKQATFTRPNGEQVFGYSVRSGTWNMHEQLAIMARMYGGDLITPDYKIVINQAPVIKGLQLYRRMFQEGIIPPAWSAAGFDSNIYMREGRAALTMGGHTDGLAHNNANQSKEAGNIKAAYFPLARELWTADKRISDSMSFTWALGILKGSQRKDAAWDFIRFLSRNDSAIEMAKNNNAPAKLSALDFQAQSYDGAAIAKEVFKYTRSALPPLENANQIIDIIGERMENVVIRGMDPQTEMDAAAREIAPLL